MKANPRPSTNEIEHEIARTRAELGLTLDALAFELAPRRVLEKGIDMVTQSVGAARPGIVLGWGVRADPAPLALLGLGAAWLIAENTGLIAAIMPQTGERAEAWPGADRDGTAAADRSPVRIIGYTGDAAIDADRAARSNGWVHQATSAARGALRSIRESSGAAIERAGEYLGEVAPSSERVRGAGGRLAGNIERSPWLLGVVAVVSGAALAMLLPSSRREREFVAQAREDLWVRAEELGHRAADGVRNMAESTRSATDR
jgi:Protein of unknown function (DUF3618)